MINKEQHTVFTRRSLILAGMKGMLFAGLAGRLYSLQILEAKHYKVLSDRNRLHSYLICPSRGNILDRTGSILASNQNSYRGILNQSQVTDLPELVEKLRDILGLSEEEVQNIFHQAKSKHRFIPLTIKEDLSWDEVARLELYLPDLNGVAIEKGQSRFYPHPFETAHVVGYVAAVSDQDANKDPILELPGIRVGKSGAEKTFDVALRGKPGIKQVEVNALRRVVRELETLESVRGQDTQLTIHLELQKKVSEILSIHESASAVVMEIHTGEVLSLVSHPGYDTNLFTNRISKKNWQNLLEHPRQALINKAIAGQYSPGSTFKMVVALAALAKEAINPKTTFYCNGHHDVNNHKFHCWKKGGHGTMNLESAITQSCDVYFYQLAGLVGIDAIADMAKNFGFGKPSGIELSGEKNGLVPSKSWKNLVKRKSWTLGETVNVSIGQGYLLATPMQLAQMTAILANGGKLIQPHLYKNQRLSITEELPVPKEHLNHMLNGMSMVVNDPHGTTYAHRIQTPGREMGGKTGTTQVCRISQWDRDHDLHHNESQPYHKKDHAIFVGYAPVHAPKFAVTVVVEHGGGGARTAAPLAKEILSITQQLIQT